MKKLINRNINITSYLVICILIFAMTITIFIAMPQPSNAAYADMGPKPSVHITFKNMPNESCYGTLLSQRSSTGPASKWTEGDIKRLPKSFTEEIWQAFNDYEDKDGFYFLQAGWECSNTEGINWTYYPPYTFKILLYYPNINTFVVSEIYERYAFNSYYAVNMSGIDISAIEEEMPNLVAKKSYNYAKETVFLVLRILCTIIIEILIALIFCFKQKNLLRIIVITNIVTQILLNVALNIIRFYSGSLVFILFYVLLEIIVFIIEAIVYGTAFKKVQDVKVWKSVLYAFLANAISFGAGFLLAVLEINI